VKVNYSFSVVENTLNEAFGVDWKTNLTLDKTPVGAGSVAQVFKGTLKRANDTIDVAVKMIHPHVSELVRTDMELLTHLANFFDRFPSLEILSLGESCRQFADVMNEQLDLTAEAANLTKFRKKFSHEKWAEFPSPMEGYVTRNVLVETLMEGTPITQYMKMTSESGDAVDKLKMKLSDLGCRLILKMIFFDNFIHGDLHPGTRLRKRDNAGLI
jgi:aarF domain-containing kinase